MSKLMSNLVPLGQICRSFPAYNTFSAPDLGIHLCLVHADSTWFYYESPDIHSKNLCSLLKWIICSYNQSIHFPAFNHSFIQKLCQSIRLPRITNLPDDIKVLEMPEPKTTNYHRKLIFGILTQLDKIWKTTIFL